MNISKCLFFFKTSCQQNLESIGIKYIVIPTAELCRSTRANQLYRDANHSDFCIIILIFKADFRIMISEVKIPANNDFNMVADKGS